MTFHGRAEVRRLMEQWHRLNSSQTGAQMAKGKTAQDRSGSFGCSYTLPRQLAKDIAFVARSLGVSQSAFLANMLASPVADLRELIEQAGPPMVDSLAVVRMRGASAQVVAERVRELVAKLGDAQ